MISVIKYFRRILLLLIYILGVLALGETHPFSQYPMYNSLPNWSYVFFFTDKNQNLIPCNHIGTTGGELAHKFYSIMENSGYSYGYEQEDPNHLKEVGAIIVDQLDFKAFALISILNKKTAFVYGTLLLLMHAGIAHVMAINITAIVYPMIIFMLNPIHLAGKFLLSAFKYATNRPFERKTDSFN